MLLLAPARPLVQVGAAGGAQALAVLIAQRDERQLEHDGRNDEGLHIEHVVRGQTVELVLVGAFGNLRAVEQEVSFDFALDIEDRVLKTARAIGARLARDAPRDEQRVACVGDVGMPRKRLAESIRVGTALELINGNGALELGKLCRRE